MNNIPFRIFVFNFNILKGNNNAQKCANFYFQIFFTILQTCNFPSSFFKNLQPYKNGGKILYLKSKIKPKTMLIFIFKNWSKSFRKFAKTIMIYKTQFFKLQILN